MHTLNQKRTQCFPDINFTTPVQGKAETIEQLVTDLNLLARGCAFKEPDEKIRDRIWLVQILTKLEEKLINVGKDLSLVKDIEISRTYELSKAQLKSMESSSKMVRGINEGQQYRRKSSNTPSKERTQSCGKCGLLHAQLWGKYTLNAGKQIIAELFVKSRYFFNLRESQSWSVFIYIWLYWVFYQYPLEYPFNCMRPSKHFAVSKLQNTSCFYFRNLKANNIVELPAKVFSKLINLQEL